MTDDRNGALARDLGQQKIGIVYAPPASHFARVVARGNDLLGVPAHQN
ncbi:MAG: hypothetical protein JRG90_19970 [Deltaproteobacteria bacterium]|nr:hypothetical protein [Deltaproteobacteria bacterium]